MVLSGACRGPEGLPCILIVENSEFSTSVSTFNCHTPSDALAVGYRGLHVEGRFRWLRRPCHIPSYAHGMSMQGLRFRPYASGMPTVCQRRRTSTD
jgi:hypothetical protein